MNKTFSEQLLSYKNSLKTIALIRERALNEDTVPEFLFAQLKPGGAN